jgi:hypothetical protein
VAATAENAPATSEVPPPRLAESCAASVRDEVFTAGGKETGAGCGGCGGMCGGYICKSGCTCGGWLGIRPIGWSVSVWSCDGKEHEVPARP